MKQGTLILTTKNGNYRVRKNGEVVEATDLWMPFLKEDRYNKVPRNWVGQRVRIGSGLIFTPVKP